MAATTGMHVASSGGLRKALLVAVGAAAIYFAVTDVFPYFVWNEASYGYYWPNRLPLIMHASGGLVAMLVGLFQLSSGFGRKGMGTHPWTGRVYLGGIVVGTIGAIVLSLTSAVYGFAWGVGLFVLAVAWFTTTAVAFLSIRRRDVEAHKQWMVRSYILTFAFVTFRIIVDHVPYEALWGISRPEMANAALWPVWVVPLLVYQIYLQYRNV